jgi:rhamnose transport system ATP-binding protein
MGMSDRILVMREGRLVAEFDREGATQEMVASAMMGEGADGQSLSSIAAPAPV